MGLFDGLKKIFGGGAKQEGTEPQEALRQGGTPPTPVNHEEPVPYVQPRVARLEEEVGRQVRRAEERGRSSGKTGARLYEYVDQEEDRIRAEVYNPARLEAAALNDLVNRFLPHVPVSITHTEQAGVYEANYRAKGDFGGQRALEAAAEPDMQQVGRAIGAIAKGATLIKENEVPIGVRTIDEHGESTARVDRSILFTPDHEKLFSYTLSASAQSVEKMVDTHAAGKGFEVRPRADRNAVYIEGNDFSARDTLKARLDECGVMHLDSHRGLMNIIKIPVPNNNFAGMVDVLEGLQKAGQQRVEQAAPTRHIEDGAVVANQTKLAALVRQATGLGGNIPDAVMAKFDADNNQFTVSVPNGAVARLQDAMEGEGLMTHVGRAGRENTTLNVSMMFMVTAIEDVCAAVQMGEYTQREFGAIVDRVAESMPKAIGQGGVSGREDARDAERRDKKNEL